MVIAFRRFEDNVGKPLLENGRLEDEAALSFQLDEWNPIPRWQKRLEQSLDGSKWCVKLWHPRLVDTKKKGRIRQAQAGADVRDPLGMSERGVVDVALASLEVQLRVLECGPLGDGSRCGDHSGITSSATSRRSTGSTQTAAPYRGSPLQSPSGND